jgi:hypothetical protein
MNEALYLRNPEQSELENIIMHSIVMIHENGFEALTFKTGEDMELRKLVSIDISKTNICY